MQAQNVSPQPSATKLWSGGNDPASSVADTDIRSNGDSQSPAQRQPSLVPPRGLNARSCNTCRRRKVKCDKQEGGCRNCRKANAECVYPSPGRVSRRPKNPKTTSERETELLKRLRRLEGVVEELSGQVELEGIKGSPASSGDRDSKIEHYGSEEGKDGKSQGGTVRVVGMDEGGASSRTWLKRLQGMGEGPPKRDIIGREFGKLVIDEGKSRYVSSSFWASLNGEVCYLGPLSNRCSTHCLVNRLTTLESYLNIPHRRLQKMTMMMATTDVLMDWR
jgi:hypothetical protein